MYTANLTPASLSQYFKILFHDFLSRLLLFKGDMAGESQKLMFLFLNAEPAVMDTGAGEASLPFKVNRSVVHGLSHDT